MSENTENSETPVADTSEVTPDASAAESPESSESPSTEQPTEVTPEEPTVQNNEAGDSSQPEAPVDNAELSAAPVSGVPSPEAVSDPKPEQTDNSERPEDGEQDVSQDSNDVPSDEQ